MLKRLYQLVAIVAIGQLVVLMGLMAFGWASGRLDRQRIGQIAMVLRGEWPGQQAATSQPVTTAPAAAASEKIRHDEELEEVLLRRLDRQRRQIEDLAALTDAARMKLLRDREAFEQEVARWERRRRAWEQQQHLDGFKRTLSYFESIDAKLAKQLLQQKKDADAAAVLAAISRRKGKAIVEECTSQQDQRWIGRILSLIEQADGQGADLAGTTMPAGQG